MFEICRSGISAGDVYVVTGSAMRGKLFPASKTDQQGYKIRLCARCDSCPWPTVKRFFRARRSPERDR